MISDGSRLGNKVYSKTEIGTFNESSVWILCVFKAKISYLLETFDHIRIFELSYGLWEEVPAVNW